MDNDQEWRAFLLSEIKDLKHDISFIRKEITYLKIKVITISSALASGVSLFLNKYFN